MDHVPHSPYLRALGAQRARLDPALESYFSHVPRGSVGIGRGVFRRVGTPRRWLWPFYRILQRNGVVAAGWHADVPFTVRNRSVGGRAIGERRLELPSGAWTMKDAVSARTHGRVIDQLGEPPVLAAAFDVSADDGALRLDSRTIGLRLGALRLRIPGVLAPRIRLRESWDQTADVQRVELTVDLPLIGRVYEYDGAFTYRIEQETS